jgi:hypothetical protein
MQDEADLEALKRWWDENGKGLVGAVAVAGLGTLGWQAISRLLDLTGGGGLRFIRLYVVDPA